MLFDVIMGIGGIFPLNWMIRKPQSNYVKHDSYYVHNCTIHNTSEFHHQNHG